VKRSQSTTRRIDPRARRTREALLQAFFALVLSQPFEELSAEQIAAHAGVGRSTFYEHFRGKNELLAASIAGPFGALADTVAEKDNTERLTRVLEHFWQNRHVARALFNGPMRARMAAVLERLVRQRLRADRAASARFALPAQLASVQIAATLFAPVTAWLTDGPACSAPRLARALRRSTRALVAAPGMGSVR
jgi:AcrR family transcriptional regulator